MIGPAVLLWPYFYPACALGIGQAAIALLTKSGIQGRDFPLSCNSLRVTISTHFHNGTAQSLPAGSSRLLSRKLRKSAISFVYQLWRLRSKFDCRLPQPRLSDNLFYSYYTYSSTRTKFQSLSLQVVGVQGAGRIPGPFLLT